MPADACIDALIWVGSEYEPFLCGSKRNCSHPPSRKKHPCFAHEAEWRGISRHVPDLPAWAVPGHSRIFLAHNGGLAARRGRIFGYFLLGRTEVLVAGPPQGAGDGPRAGEERPGGSRAGKGPRSPVRRARCWDGVTQIVTHRWEPGGSERVEVPMGEKSVGVTRYRPGRWVRTGERCPPFPPECLDGDVKTVRCVDGSLIVVAVCREGGWRPTGMRCARPISIECEELKVERPCKGGVRTSPGGLYLVDELDAAITDAFATEMHDNGIDLDTMGGRAATLGAAHDRFVEIADARVAEGLEARVPPELEGFAQTMGTMVLFEKPPIFESYPRAAFLGLRHIDGDDLVRQVAAGARKVKIRNCPKARSKALEVPEMAARMGAMLGVEAELGESFLAALASVAVEQVEGRGVFDLPGIGCFRRRGAGGEGTAAEESRKRLAGELGCEPAEVDALFAALAALARAELSRWRELRVPGLGRLQPRATGIKLAPLKVARELGVGFTRSAELGPWPG